MKTTHDRSVMKTDYIMSPFDNPLVAAQLSSTGGTGMLVGRFVMGRYYSHKMSKGYRNGELLSQTTLF